MDKSRIILTASLVGLLIIINAFSFLLGRDTTITGMAIAETEEDTCKTPEFKTHTEAVCEEKGFYKECKDILVVECGDIKQEIGIVNGSASVESD